MNRLDDVRERERPVAEEAHRQHRLRGAELPPDERAEDDEAADERADDLGRAPSRRRCRARGPRRSRTGRRSRARAPGRSSASSGRATRRAATARAARARGRSGRSARRSSATRCRETTAPPTSGPIATASPLMPPHAPSASPRRSGGTAAERIVSVSGITIAPPRPCTARAASSAPIDGASAAAAEASVKMARPIENSRRRPKRSPSAAPVRSSTAKVSVYALTVHSRPREAGVQVLADHRQRGRHDEVVERDHEERHRGDRERPPHVCFVSHHLPPGEKKSGLLRSCSPRAGAAPTARSARARPSRRGRSSASRCAKKSASVFRLDARDALDVGDEVAEAVPDDRADLGVVAGGVGLHLGPQVDPVGLRGARRRPRRSRAAPPRPACPRRPAGTSRASGGSSGRRRRCRAPSSSRRAGRRRAARCRPGGRSPRSRRRAGPCSANTAIAASRISSRRSSFDFRSVVVTMSGRLVMTH